MKEQETQAMRQSRVYRCIYVRLGNEWRGGSTAYITKDPSIENVLRIYPVGGPLGLTVIVCTAEYLGEGGTWLPVNPANVHPFGPNPAPRPLPEIVGGSLTLADEMGLPRGRRGRVTVAIVPEGHEDPCPAITQAEDEDPANGPIQILYHTEWHIES